jgi:ferric-dicitrate binding protein FerR (iron transport regulator)
MSYINDIFEADDTGKSRKPLSEKQLLAYFEGQMSVEERHRVEEWLAGDGMESDALEGLRELSPQDTKASIEKINFHLRKKIKEKKRARRLLRTDQVTLLAVCIILLLAVVAYLVLRKLAI